MINNNSRAGLLYAFAAFSIWGGLPIYFKMLDQVSAFEVLGHRVVWSSLILGVFLLVSGRWREFVQVIKTPKTLGILLVSALLIGANWLGFIWGVVNDRILETSLGYYINPLINVLFGYVFLQERLNRVQILAIGLAAIAVITQIVFLGTVPWISFVLAFSFGSYTLVRKMLDVNPAIGLAVETLLLLPFAFGYFYWLVQNNQHAFRVEDVDVAGMLMLAGVITTVPLVLFNMATKALSLTVVGLMQYMTPSISFALGVLVYGEPLGVIQSITFGLIWLALIIFTVDGFVRQRKTLGAGAVMESNIQAN